MQDFGLEHWKPEKCLLRDALNIAFLASEKGSERDVLGLHETPQL